MASFVAADSCVRAGDAHLESMSTSTARPAPRGAKPAAAAESLPSVAAEFGQSPNPLQDAAAALAARVGFRLRGGMSPDLSFFVVGAELRLLLSDGAAVVVRPRVASDHRERPNRSERSGGKRHDGVLAAA